MKLITDKDYYEKDIKETEQVIMTAIEMQEFIEQKLENVPPKGKLHSVWKKEVNALMDEYNNSFGHVYTHVK